MLPAHVGASRSALATLQRDFARLRTLEHPHIARLIELGHNGQQYYVTGERLDGEPLSDVLTHLLPERLEVEEADDIVRAVGSALVYAHEHGIAHGDVRAENVLVTMDRRIVLTNFLARRVVRLAARPPREGDDLKGLARLAAELYTGSASPHALRSAVHGNVPAARLNAIRAVLEASTRRSGNVAQFLAAAGLAFAGVDAPPRRADPQPARPRSVWRLVWPMAAAMATAALVVSYYANGSASVPELTERGLDALRFVAGRVVAATTRESAPPTNTNAQDSAADGGGLGPPPSAPVEPVPAEPPTLREPPPETQPAAATAPEAMLIPIAARRTAAAPREPARLSFGLARIAAREDHSVVAIDVVRSGDTSGETAVAWWTTPGTALEDDDYASVGRQTLTFPAGATRARVLIPIVNDGMPEPDEAFTVHLSRPRGGLPGAVTATRVTLYDDD